MELKTEIQIMPTQDMWDYFRMDMLLWQMCCQTTKERMLLRREMLALGYRQRVAAPKLQKGQRLIIHTGHGSDTLDHAELVRSILAMKYPNELIRPAFCVRCFQDLPENKRVCTWCGFWNGGGNELDMFWRPGGRKR